MVSNILFGFNKICNIVPKILFNFIFILFYPIYFHCKTPALIFYMLCSMKERKS